MCDSVYTHSRNCNAIMTQPDMADISHMTLKVLYSLEDEASGSYLARSKKPHQVRVLNIPNPSAPQDANSTLRVGAVSLAAVLDEIELNSPEVLDIYAHKQRGALDYNLYYHDICEANEPLVSLGLLSKIRSRIDAGQEEENEDDEEEDDEEEDDEFIVTGRVCSNFAAMLRRSYSNASSKKRRRNEAGSEDSTVSPDTLEVKLRLRRVITSRPAPESISPAPQTSSRAKPAREQYPAPALTTVASRSARANKRQTNPKPAPKAIRTQSLPIWDARANPAGPGFMKTSIAHKIYMADRQTGEMPGATHRPDAMTYEIMALQPDSSVHRVKVDDAISKRFDFMNKKKPAGSVKSPSAVAPTKKQNKRVTKAAKTKGKTAPPKILPTMATMAVAQPPVQSRAGAGADKTPQDDECNKENVPPGTSGKANTSRDMYASLLNFGDSNMDWLEDFSDVAGLMEGTAAEPGSASGTGARSTLPLAFTPTPRDIPTVEDMDRTSPIDTLSMPLMELEPAAAHTGPHTGTSARRGSTLAMGPGSGPAARAGDTPGQSSGAGRARTTSCHDQLRRLPLLAGGAAAAVPAPASASASTDPLHSDATMMVHYSTPGKSPGGGYLGGYDAQPQTEAQAQEQEQGSEREHSEKRAEVMPSSPGMMFADADGAEMDIFSSFADADGLQEETPATSAFTSSDK